MADFCSKCEETYFDINLAQLALELDREHSINFICECCNRRCIYKDAEGLIYLGTKDSNDIELNSEN